MGNSKSPKKGDGGKKRRNFRKVIAIARVSGYKELVLSSRADEKLRLLCYPVECANEIKQVSYKYITGRVLR